MKKILTGALAVTVAATMAWAAADDDIKARQTAMKAAGAAAKAQDFAALAEAAKAAQAAFKADTSGQGSMKTEASPAIWTDAAGFDKIMNDFVTLAAAGDKAVFGTCKSCHQGYRVKN